MIINGDCLEVLETLAENSVDAVVTDPPYDFSTEDKQKYHKEIMRVSRHGAIIFCPPENQWMPNAHQFLFWIKPISTKNTSRRYSRFVEMIQVFGMREAWNIGRHWSQYTNVFTDLVEGQTSHPHEKPVSLMRRLLLNHLPPGGTVLDPFMGSGSCGCAAALEGFGYIGIEKEKEYFEIAEKRIAHASTR